MHDLCQYTSVYEVTKVQLLSICSREFSCSGGSEQKSFTSRVEGVPHTCPKAQVRGASSPSTPHMHLNPTSSIHVAQLRSIVYMATTAAVLSGPACTVRPVGRSFIWLA